MSPVAFLHTPADYTEPVPMSRSSPNSHKPPSDDTPADYCNPEQTYEQPCMPSTKERSCSGVYEAVDCSRPMELAPDIISTQPTPKNVQYGSTTAIINTNHTMFKGQQQIKNLANPLYEFNPPSSNSSS